VVDAEAQGEVAATAKALHCMMHGYCCLAQSRHRTAALLRITSPDCKTTDKTAVTTSVVLHKVVTERPLCYG